MTLALKIAAALVAAQAACGFAGQATDGGPGIDGGDAGGAPPRIIIMIGDGMGRTLEAASSQFGHGRDDALGWHGFEHRGELLTASFSGITDSAASATAMATGELTYNGMLAIDRDGRELESVFELARRAGMSTGIVTTTPVTHATGAAFTAHETDRYDTADIADEQVRETRPDVVLGGGRSDFGPALLSELEGQGAAIVTDAAGLAALDLTSPRRLVGLFADGHLPYVRDRGDETPSLAAMTTRAIEALEDDPQGFILVVEAGRIDRACHDRYLALAIDETLELDEVAVAVGQWADRREGVTQLVLADHETGGLDVVVPAPAGELPNVTWRWGEHTNRSVNVYGRGPGSEAVAGAREDPRIIHAILAGLVESRPIEPPARVAVANGALDDLRAVAASQDLISDFGASGRLDSLSLDADHYGIVVGVEGTFSMASSSVVVLVDRDFGSGAGARAMATLSSTSTEPVDLLLARLALELGAVPGFAADYAAVSVAGVEDSREVGRSGAGWRALRTSDGMPLTPPILGVAINYADGVRATATPAVPRAGAGLEIGIEIDRLYPELGGSIPIGAEIAVAVVMTSVLGGALSNQALPSFEVGFEGQVRAVAVIELDVNRDGVVDSAPRVRVEGP